MREHELREIQHVRDTAMTARQIREALESVDDDAAVFFVCSYGDRGKTQQALPVGEVIGDCSARNLRTTGYSESGIAMVEDDENESEIPDDDDFPVTFLRT